MRSINRFLLPLIAIFAVSAIASGEVYHLGEFGKTYRIEERDAIDEIKERAGKLDFTALARETAKKIKSYRPPDIARRLPDAEKRSTHIVDVTYVLERDIYDDEGKLLYPKGYTFNPLDYIKLPNQYLFLNGNKESHLKWFEKSEFYNKVNVTVLITEGPYYELMERLKRPVFYATNKIIQKMKIKRLPSIARQKGNKIEVEEFPIIDKNGGLK